MCFWPCAPSVSRLLSDLCVVRPNVTDKTGEGDYLALCKEAGLEPRANTHMRQKTKKSTAENTTGISVCLPSVGVPKLIL